MNDEGKTISGDNPPTEQQGIFSTPDLSVNSDNLEEIKPELSEDNKSRIASAFAQTDATQKHDQLSEQMVEQEAISGTVLPAGAGFSNNATASSVTGDIKIPGVKKKSKLPIILAILVLLSVVGGVTGWFLLSNTHTEVTPLTAFDEYVEYLKTGPEDLRSKIGNSLSTDEWFFFQIDNSALFNADRQNYLAELAKKYDTFTKIFNEQQFAVANAGEIREILPEYAVYQQTLAHSLTIDSLTDDILGMYTQNGASAAYNYITEHLPIYTNEDAVLLHSTTVALNSYANSQLNLLETYDNAGCIENGTVLVSCVSEAMTNLAVMEVINQQDTDYTAISSYIPLLKNRFTNITNALVVDLRSEDE